MIGKNKGGRYEKITESLVDVFEKNKSYPKEAQELYLNDAIQESDSSAIRELNVEVLTLENDLKKSMLEHDQVMHTEQQKTIRSSADKAGIRPKVANRHSWFTAAYVMLFEAAEAFGHGTGADWEILTLIASPTLAWFGFRTWDKFSKQGG
jgi:cytochrome c1